MTTTGGAGVSGGIGATGPSEFKGSAKGQLTPYYLGCDRPASWTSGHHLVHWIHGGPTDLPNLALLCYRHHWFVHEGGWQILRGDGGRIVTIPPTVIFALPRGPD